MPITVKVVSQDIYDAWVTKAATGDVVLSEVDLAKPVEVAASN